MKEEELKGPKELVEIKEPIGFEEDDCDDVIINNFPLSFLLLIILDIL